jgi:hypothetical protein
MKNCVLTIFLLALTTAGFAQEARRASDGTCVVFPCVVATLSVTNQTAAVSETALFTPTTSGLFRVTYYMESSPILASVWGLQFKYADDLKVRSEPVVRVNPGQSPSFSLMFRDVAGQPITYAVTQIKSSPDAYYDLFITVEQLQ